ncbi:S-layer protein (plasmid) [Sulfitobacter indolifex]|uniref:DUF4214 domain-containing protein n=1 Tax=Sulfitobacter indolifex HEL-45 TaxID=391624 RepID=A0ABM9X142_9RHOB|nr:DUF4214 domain-containing protein [Sulfitobacter indolifex]EDQ03183.1 hypothetical protein OIHEL45_20336 [Sulfitobacter indolifex HEL-45]UOA20590.1 S-layer protein [Sulfitobacter indolifex]UOA20841.1 S-layer protein [Sulfitobacter indolifex]
MATSTQINAITALYVGYFDRAPDPAGLQFWIEQIDNGREFNTIAADFAASPEAVALYPYLSTPGVSSPAAFITNIYANLFGRTPDDEGLEFWTGVLENGSVSVADMIEAIIMGARDDATAGTFDKSVLDNKVEVGLDFALKTGNVAGFEFDADARAAAVAVVNGVTEDQATVDAAKAATDAYIATGTLPGGAVGETFTLTAGTDNFVGTANADTFQAVENDGTAATTLTAFDKLDGGAGNDTLEMIVDGTLTVPGGVSIKNIETINLARDSGSGTINAAVFVGASQIWQIDNAGDISGLIDGQAAGFRDTAVNDTITYDDDVTTATVALDNVVSGGTLDIDGDDIETVNVAGSIDAAAATLTVDLGADGAGADAVTALNLSLESNTTLTVTGSNGLELETVNGSGSTGDLSMNFAVPSNVVSSISTGSGDDSVLNVGRFYSDADVVTIDLGAGNDTVTIDDDNGGASINTRLEITLGAGSDMIESEYGNNIGDASEAEFLNGLTTVSDFNADDDVLDITAFSSGRETLSNVEIAAIASEASLFDAVVLAASYMDGVNTFTTFNYGGNAYVLHDFDTDSTFSDDDGLIELVGFSVNDFDASNLIT